MINMSYCRIENTYAALQEVVDAMKDYRSRTAFENDLPETEKVYLDQLKKLIAEFNDLNVG